MDKRKLEQFKRQAEESSEEMNIHKLINSAKMNEALVGNAAAMFDLEFILKQKAQLKYLQAKSQQQSNSKLLQMLNHSFLWSPTPSFYVFTMALYLVLRRRFRLTFMHLIPMMTIPATLDYYKRDHYIKLSKKEFDEFKKSTKVVSSILAEKKQYVTFEQVLTYCFHLNLDQKVDQRRLLLPIAYF